MKTPICATPFRCRPDLSGTYVNHELDSVTIANPLRFLAVRIWPAFLLVEESAEEMPEIELHRAFNTAHHNLGQHLCDDFVDSHVCNTELPIPVIESTYPSPILERSVFRESGVSDVDKAKDDKAAS
jgi:hypothetical protein